MMAAGGVCGDELTPYLVKSLPNFDKLQSKGSGSYGSVYLVTVNGFPCIAKRLHKILVGHGAVSDKERSSVIQRFREECILMSRLRHPNIVQFIGVHYGKTAGELTLLMEGLHTDLEKCLATYSYIPLPVQLSILLDVAYGLLYLHSQEPPIVHRDVKASNVLLTNDMRAKLADLGVSKILDLQPLSESTHTLCPGTPAVMPLEALIEKPSYSTKLDTFSFGALVLHVVNHEFPLPSKTDKFKKGKLQLTERSSAIETMGRSHCLHPLVASCLRDDAKRRPTTIEICSELEKLSKASPQSYGNILDMYEKIHHMRSENEVLSKKLKAEEKKCSKIELSLMAREAKWGEVVEEQRAERERLKKELEARTHESDTLKGYDEMKSKLTVYKLKLASMESDCGDYKQRLAKTEGDLELAKVEIKAARDSLAQKLSEIKQLHTKNSEDVTDVGYPNPGKTTHPVLATPFYFKVSELSRRDNFMSNSPKEEAKNKSPAASAKAEFKSLQDKISMLEIENEKLQARNAVLTEILDKETARPIQRTGGVKVKRKRSSTDPTPMLEQHPHPETHPLPEEDMAGVSILAPGQKSPPSEIRILKPDPPI